MRQPQCSFGRGGGAAAAAAAAGPRSGRRRFPGTTRGRGLMEASGRRRPCPAATTRRIGVWFVVEAEGAGAAAACGEVDRKQSTGAMETSVLTTRAMEIWVVTDRDYQHGTVPTAAAVAAAARASCLFDPRPDGVVRASATAAAPSATPVAAAIITEAGLGQAKSTGPRAASRRTAGAGTTGERVVAARVTAADGVAPAADHRQHRLPWPGPLASSPPASVSKPLSSSSPRSGRGWRESWRPSAPGFGSGMPGESRRGGESAR